MRNERPGTPGSHWDGDGVSFMLYTSVAEQVELCLFDETGRETKRHHLSRSDDGLWNFYLHGGKPGQHYGYRVHGEFNPDQGLRCNPAKLLTDPWARLLKGSFEWNPAVFDYLPGSAPGNWQMNAQDSAPFVPKSVVTDPQMEALSPRPAIPWREAIIYEANVRGFTMRHPELEACEPGRFKGLSNGRILEYLKALGITSLELQPVHAWIDESFLAEQGRRNFWGYNSIGFFAPETRLAGENPVSEFREMVNAIHDAGIEVLLDVVYNHTGESDGFGPTLALRGIDNLAYYRVEAGHPGQYVNDTGTGNTINADHSRVQELVLESLCYWHREMGVDGFRFDLATILGRGDSGFETTHPLLRAINEEPRLNDARLIAEPWDPGPGGYQLGRFPPRWSEWNDRYRDALREFWRGGDQNLAELARRLHGSSDIFDTEGRGPLASVNYIASHDGFTLMDAVSYNHRHNEANGQNNRDGHAHNLSCNHGVEGDTDRPAILALRRRHRLNLLASLLFSQGVPMLLAGDEFGNSQQGNNNAYAQDNETAWLDWAGLQADPEFTQSIIELITLRKRLPLLRQSRYLHADGAGTANPGIAWYRPDGSPMSTDDWTNSRAVLNLLTERDGNGQESSMVAIAINGNDHESAFRLPEPGTGRHWCLEFSSDLSEKRKLEGEFFAAAWSISCLSVGPVAY